MTTWTAALKEHRRPTANVTPATPRGGGTRAAGGTRTMVISLANRAAAIRRLKARASAAGSGGRWKPGFSSFDHDGISAGARPTLKAPRHAAAARGRESCLSATGTPKRVASSSRRRRGAVDGSAKQAFAAAAPSIACRPSHNNWFPLTMKATIGTAPAIVPATRFVRG